jgi:hypothetical protein
VVVLEISNPAGGTKVTLAVRAVPLMLYVCSALGVEDVWVKAVNEPVIVNTGTVYVPETDCVNGVNSELALVCVILPE